MNKISLPTTTMYTYTGCEDTGSSLFKVETTDAPHTVSLKSQDVQLSILKRQHEPVMRDEAGLGTL